MSAARRRLRAITHVPSPQLTRGERTYVDDAPVDYARALAQHEAYRQALAACGAAVAVLDANRELPDGVFVEDTALVLDEVAVMMSMGAASRRSEPPAIEAALREYRPIERVRLPATIDGGDIVRAGRDLYVGRSARTNGDGIAALAEVVAPYGYRVTAVPVEKCLHLKSACTALGHDRFLVNRDWIDVSPLPPSGLVDVAPGEPWAGDALVIGHRVIASDAFPDTIDLLVRHGFDALPVSVSEFAKVEGGVTCMSLVFEAD